MRAWIVAVVVWIGFLGGASYGGEGEPLQIGSRTQMFLDGRFLQPAKNVKISVCPPVKTNEKCFTGKFGAYGQIMPVDGVYRGYYALTKDGTHWRQVTAGEASEPDDILGFRIGGSTVFTDPKAAPDSRYISFDGLRNQVWASKDGTGWRTLKKGVFPPSAAYPHGMDSQNIMFYDTRLKKYVAYVRMNKGYPLPKARRAYFNKQSNRIYGRGGLHSARAIGRAVSDTPLSFPHPQLVMEPDEKDPRAGGTLVMDFYIPQVIQYPHAQDVYLLFNSRYLHYRDWFIQDMKKYPGLPGSGPVHNIGPLDTGFAASRDGIVWERYDRKPWIELGMEGRFDSKKHYMCRGLHVQGDEIWMYYIGYDRLHGTFDSQDETPIMSRVVLRKDGFTCVEPTAPNGEFTTPSLKFAGDRLILNMNTSAIGHARVEVQDSDGKSIAGFALSDCDRMHTTNSTHRTVTWHGKSNVASLANQAIRLRFELSHGVKLYSFRFGS